MAEEGVQHHDLVAIGGSAGGVSAMQEILKELPEGLEATIFLVLHRHSASDTVLIDLLDRHTPLRVVSPVDEQTYEPGHVYVAPADQHMLVHDGRIRLTYGPRENRSRPAIDPLFRSIAIEGSSRVVGILLTGMLDDGVSGLAAIRRCGGVTIVQDPDEASYPQLPRNAIEAMETDDTLRLNAIARRIISLSSIPAEAPPRIPDDIRMEVEIAMDARSEVQKEESMGHLVPLSCPECGGPLWNLENDSVQRYRCHVGHAYTTKALLEEQHEGLEKALWVALRTLEERAKMLDSLARGEEQSTRERSSTTFAERAREVRTQAETIRKVILHGREHGKIAPQQASNPSTH